MSASGHHSLLFLISQLLPAQQTIFKDISPSHYQTLHLLTVYGAMNLSELAKLRGVKKSSMSATMEQLISTHRVLLAQSKSDRRQKLYLITNKGRTLYQEKTTAGLGQVEKIWPGTDIKEKQQFRSMLQTLLTAHHD